MKGFCSGSSIEIDLELDESEISRLEREVVSGNIIRGHEKPPKFVDISLKVENMKGDELMGLKIIPDGADFESTEGYEITISAIGYEYLREGGIVDRPKLGTKVSIYKK